MLIANLRFILLDSKTVMTSDFVYRNTTVLFAGIFKVKMSFSFVLVSGKQNIGKLRVSPRLTVRARRALGVVFSEGWETI